MSGVNETKFLVQNKLRWCKCGLNESICNSKQKWDHKWRCEFKELVASTHKEIKCQILVQRIMTVIRHAKLTNIWILKISIRIEDEILNKTETSIDDKTAKK